MPASRSPLKDLVELSERLSDEAELDALLDLVVRSTMKLIGASHASLRVLDDSGRRLVASARAGRGSDKKPAGFRANEGLLGWVVAKGEPVSVPDTKRDARFVAVPGQGFSIRSLVAVPLRARGLVMGVLSVSSPRPKAFTKAHVEVLRLLANTASPLIDRARLEVIATTDFQTKALNVRVLRPRLVEEIERAERHGSPLSLLLLDLDHFKDVNDTYGHEAGDRVLRHFTDIVHGSVRRIDALVRRGGEEFVLVLPVTGERSALAVAERVRERFESNPTPLPDGRGIAHTVSIGVATWKKGESPEDLERRADVAMYRAKATGRNCVVVATDEADPLLRPTWRPPRKA